MPIPAAPPPKLSCRCQRLSLKAGGEDDRLVAMKNFLITAMVAVAGCAVAQAAPVSAAGKEAQSAANEYRAAVMTCEMGWCFDAMYPPIKRTLADRLASRTQGDNTDYIMGKKKMSTELAEARMKKNLDALRAQYVEMGRQMKAAGFKVERFVIGAPYAEYELVSSGSALRSIRESSRKDKYKEAEDIKLQGDRSRLVVLPTTLWFSVPDPTSGRRVRMERRDFIYAVRDEAYRDNRNTRGTEPNKWYFIDSNTNVNTLRTYFPTLPLNIKTPDTGDRPLQ